MDALLQQSTPCEIVVVENGSTDGSLEFLTKNYPQITVLPQKTNLGFDGGVNVGIRYALEKKYEYIALLNNDAIAHKEVGRALDAKLLGECACVFDFLVHSRRGHVLLQACHVEVQFLRDAQRARFAGLARCLDHRAMEFPVLALQLGCQRGSEECGEEGVDLIQDGDHRGRFAGAHRPPARLEQYIECVVNNAAGGAVGHSLVNADGLQRRMQCRAVHGLVKGCQVREACVQVMCK